MFAEGIPVPESEVWAPGGSGQPDPTPPEAVALRPSAWATREWKRGEAGWMDDPVRRTAMFAEEVPGETGQPDPAEEAEALRPSVPSGKPTWLELAVLEERLMSEIESRWKGMLGNVKGSNPLGERLEAIEAWVAELGAPAVRRVNEIEGRLVAIPTGGTAVAAAHQRLDVLETAVNEMKGENELLKAAVERLAGRVTLLEETTVADDEPDDGVDGLLVERLAGKIALLEQTIVELRRLIGVRDGRILEVAAERDRFRERAVELEGRLVARDVVVVPKLSEAGREDERTSWNRLAEWADELAANMRELGRRE